MSPLPPPPTLDQVKTRALKLPCSPTLMPKLSSTLRDPKSTTGEIEACISLDESLAAATLRLANSAVYASRSVDTIAEAVLRVGAREVYRLASLVLLNRWETGGGGTGFEPGDFSRHAVCTAIAAETLADELGRVDPQLTYTAGLVCDIGKLALAHVCGEYHDAILARCQTLRETWEEAEKAVLGYHHGEVSTVLLQAWSFPETLVQASRHVVDPAGAPSALRPLMAHLHAGQSLAVAMGPGSTTAGYLIAVQGDFLLEHGFEPDVMERALGRAAERASALLGQKLASGPLLA